MKCYVMRCYEMSWTNMLWDVMKCYIMRCYELSWTNMLWNVMKYYVMRCFTIICWWTVSYEQWLIRCGFGFVNCHRNYAHWLKKYESLTYERLYCCNSQNVCHENFTAGWAAWQREKHQDYRKWRGLQSMACDGTGRKITQWFPS